MIIMMLLIMTLALIMTLPNDTMIRVSQTAFCTPGHCQGNAQGRTVSAAQLTRCRRNATTFVDTSRPPNAHWHAERSYCTSAMNGGDGKRSARL